MQPYNRQAALARIARDTARAEKDMRQAIADFDSAAKIIPAVCEFYKLTIKDLLRHSNKASVVWPRHVAIYFIKSKTTYPHLTIGALFNHKGNSCVAWALKSVRDQLDTSKRVRREIQALRASIESTSSTPSISQTMKPSKPCPVPGCHTLCHPDYLMCVTHWRIVAKPLQNSVWREFRLKPGSESHLAACSAAITAAIKTSKTASQGL